MPEPSQDQDIPGSHAANSGLQVFACAVRQKTAAETGSEWRIVLGDMSYSALVSKSRVASSPVLPDVCSSVQRTWRLNLAALGQLKLETFWRLLEVFKFVPFFVIKRRSKVKGLTVRVRLRPISPLYSLTSEPTETSEAWPNTWNPWETINILLLERLS